MHHAWNADHIRHDHQNNTDQENQRSATIADSFEIIFISQNFYQRQNFVWELSIKSLKDKTLQPVHQSLWPTVFKSFLPNESKTDLNQYTRFTTFPKCIPFHFHTTVTHDYEIGLCNQTLHCWDQVYILPLNDLFLQALSEWVAGLEKDVNLVDSGSMQQQSSAENQQSRIIRTDIFPQNLSK